MNVYMSKVFLNTRHWLSFFITSFPGWATAFVHAFISCRYIPMILFERTGSQERVVWYTWLEWESWARMNTNSQSQMVYNGSYRTNTPTCIILFACLPQCTQLAGTAKVTELPSQGAQHTVNMCHRYIKCAWKPGETYALQWVRVGCSCVLTKLSSLDRL